MTHATNGAVSHKPASPRACPAAAAGARLLEQCESLVALLSDDAYTAPSEVMAGGTIGKHIRHSLDHFSAVVNALGDPDAAIDYDHRRRGVPVETDRAAARRTIAETISRLRAIDVAASAAPVAVRVMLTEDGAEATLASTVGRELAFAAHHAVHHHAMIGAIAGALGVRCPDGFGKAPSTLHHEHAAHPSASN